MMKVLVIPSWYPTEQAPLLGSFYKEETEALAARGVEAAVAYVSVDGDMNPAHHGIRRSVMNTGIVPTAKDSIITLSTCTGNQTALRLVVQAVLDGSISR